MLWKTVGDNLEEEFNEWCAKVKATPDPRMMIEFLGASGYLKIKKAAKKFVKERRFPKMDHTIPDPIREGFIRPACCVYYEKD